MDEIDLQAGRQADVRGGLRCVRARKHPYSIPRSPYSMDRIGQAGLTYHQATLTKQTNNFDGETACMLPSADMPLLVYATVMPVAYK